MNRSQDELSVSEKQDLVEQIIKKKAGDLDKDWSEISAEFGLNLNTETQRKAGVGVKLVSDAKMVASDGGCDQSGGYIERQKMRDQTAKVNAEYRSQSRSELLRETIATAIGKQPEMKVRHFPHLGKKNLYGNRELVVALGDIHYGANIRVEGLNGEALNIYNHTVFEERMKKLLDEVEYIVAREDVQHVHLFLVGDQLDGMLRQTQLIRLEYGQVESTIRLSEHLAYWIAQQVEFCGEVDVYASSGNHSEIRPLKSKKREFEDENLERIVVWYLAERLRNIDRIHVHDTCKKYVKADVCGYSFLLLHGDSEKNIQDLATETIRLYKTPIDYFVCGHKHRESEYPTGSTPNGDSIVIRVPSICGTDSYAHSKGYGGKAGATAIVMEEGYGRRCVYPIVLQ